MGKRVFIDTNVLVYAYDTSEAWKQARAIETLDILINEKKGIISPQVLIEFVAVVTLKIPHPLSIDEAYRSLENYLHSLLVVNHTGWVVLEAVRGVRDHKFSIWDAQIWASARINQIPFVLSEDFATGSTIEGVTFINPFEKNFSIITTL